MKLVRAFLVSEEALAVAAMSVMALLPVAELVARYTGLNGVPGSTVFVQHLTLWVHSWAPRWPLLPTVCWRSPPTLSAG